MLTPQWESAFDLVGVHFMDSDVFNCPQSLLLAASRPGFCHLCNHKYCPPIIPSDHVTQSSAISPDPFQDLYIFLAWNGVSQNICGSLPDYDLWWGFLSVCYYSELWPGMILHTCLLLSLTPNHTCNEAWVQGGWVPSALYHGACSIWGQKPTPWAPSQRF